MTEYDQNQYSAKLANNTYFKSLDGFAALFDEDVTEFQIT